MATSDVLQMTPPGSAHGTNAAASVSKTSAKTGRTSQRAFGLPSGRSSTSVGDTDDHFAVKQNINITTKSQQNKTHTSLLSSRTREDSDLNLCLGDDVFTSHPSTKDGMACRSRNTSRSDSNEFAAGGNISHGDAGRNLNSIANNMTSLAMSPGTKASFLGLENSYQNLKPKTPINQVKKGVSHDDRVCHQAAVCIQRWYRRCRAASAALEEDGLKRMLAAKRRDLEEKRDREREQERERERKERDRAASREEKARQARQRAIEVRVVIRLRAIEVRVVIRLRAIEVRVVIRQRAVEVRVVIRQRAVEASEGCYWTEDSRCEGCYWTEGSRGEGCYWTHGSRGDGCY